MAELHVTTTQPFLADVPLTFGDGVGFSTLAKMFDGLDGYVVGINGRDFIFIRCDRLDDDWAFVVREYYDANTDRRGPEEVIPLAEVANFHIF